MKTIVAAAALALILTAPAMAQQTTPAATTANAPAAPKEKAEKAKAAKAEKAKPAKDAKAAKADKDMPERANKGGATRGADRAGQVKDMNSTRKTN